MVVSVRGVCFTRNVLTHKVRWLSRSRSFVTALSSSKLHENPTKFQRFVASNFASSRLSFQKASLCVGLEKFNPIMGTVTEEQSNWTALKVRNTFLDYFEKNEHTFGISFHMYSLISISRL